MLSSLIAGGPVRDRFTWLSYLMLAYYAFLQAAIGPLMPFLREELSLSYTAGALHMSAFAVGMVLAGVTGDRLARLGRPVLFWGGAAGMAMGALALMAGPSILWTVTAVLLMGYCGSVLLISLQAALTQLHGEQRATVLSEANVAASIAATLAPLLVGGLQQAGPGWRGSLLVAVALLLLLFVLFRGEPVPHAQVEVAATETGRGPLPVVFWAYWSVLCLSVAVEWCLVFWSAEYLVSGVGLAKTTASTLVSLFFVAMVLGRLAGSQLTRYRETSFLLLWALLLTSIGFLLFWLSPVVALNIGGLFLAGLGVANLFPLTLAAAVGIDPARADNAAARISLGAGLAILLAPLLVGWIADLLVVRSALGLVAIFIFLALVATLGARHLARSARLAPREQSCA